MTAMATEPTTPTDSAGEPRPIDELRRYTPEEVADNRWLPWKSPAIIRRKCHAKLIPHHSDGGVITFTADDIRAYNAASVTLPLSAAKRPPRAAA